MEMGKVMAPELETALESARGAVAL